MTEHSGSAPVDLEKEAKSLYKAGKYFQAANLFDKAAVLYEEQGDKTLSAEMKNNQSVSHLKSGKPDLALAAVQGTKKVFAEADETLKMAMALANEAAAYQDLGSRDQAINLFTQARDIFKNLGEDQLLLETSQSLSSLKLKSRNIPGALFAMQEGLEQIEKPNLRQKLLLNLLRIPNKLIEK